MTRLPLSTQVTVRVRVSAVNGDDGVVVPRRWLTDLLNGLAQPFAPVLTANAGVRAVQLAHAIGAPSPAPRITRAYLPRSPTATATDLAALAVQGCGTREAADLLGVPLDAAWLWMQSHGIDLWPAFVANDKAREARHNESAQPGRFLPTPRADRDG